MLQGDRRKKILSVASNASDGWRTTFTPFSSDQMIRNLSMKIGEVDSGSARLLCAARVNLTNFHAQISDHLVAAGGGDSCHNM